MEIIPIVRFIKRYKPLCELRKKKSLRQYRRLPLSSVKIPSFPDAHNLKWRSRKMIFPDLCASRHFYSASFLQCFLHLFLYSIVLYSFSLLFSRAKTLVKSLGGCCISCDAFIVPASCLCHFVNVIITRSPLKQSVIFWPQIKIPKIDVFCNTVRFSLYKKEIS